MYRVAAVILASCLLSATLQTAPLAAQVNLPEGFEIVEFDVDDLMKGSPRINNCGEIVYVKDRFENSRVYLYDNGKFTRLTEYNNGLGVGQPDINEHGVITWYQAMRRTPESSQIVRYVNGRSEILGLGSGPVLNDSGIMAWQIFKRLTCNIESDIVRFDGRELAVTDSDLTNQSVEINRHGWITWGQQDLCLNPWEGKIMLYAEGEISVLPSRASQAQAPATNDLGQVSWGTSEAGIEIWESGETRVVLDEGSNVRLNNLGDMYFLRFNSQTYWDGYLYRISNGEPVVHRLTDDPVWNIDGDINDWTEVVWRWKLQGESHGGIRLLRRIRTGDSEFDQDIDLDDFRAFSNCMTGPVRSDRLCDCRFLDIDHDGDVDLADFSRVQLGFTGDE